MTPYQSDPLQMTRRQFLGRTATGIGAAALAVSFVAGLLFSFNPVALAAIPVSMAYVTKARGGYGAVREVAEMILKAQDEWDKILSKIA